LLKCLKRSKELGPGEVHMMITKIESSTEGARVKSGAAVDDTKCVMVSDELYKYLVDQEICSN